MCIRIEFITYTIISTTLYSKVFLTYMEITGLHIYVLRPVVTSSRSP